jgi:hypothetical protein
MSTRRSYAVVSLSTGEILSEHRSWYVADVQRVTKFAAHETIIKILSA